MRELKRHIMCDRASEDSAQLYDPISGSVAPRDAADASEPGSAMSYYFFRPAARPEFNWELTTACSLRCAHCFQDTEPTPCDQPVEVSDAAIERAIGVLGRSRADEVSLTGGEPLLVSNLACVLDAVRDASPDIRIRVLGSGRHIAGRPWMPESIEAMRRVGATVRLPLYGASAKTHDGVTRTVGSHADITALARALSSAGVPVIMAVGVFRETAEELARTVKLASELATCGVAVSTVLYPPKDGGSRPRSPEPVSASQLMRMLDWPATAALATQYLSLEDPCESGCRYPTIAADGRLHGCDVVSLPAPGQDTWTPHAEKPAPACEVCAYGAVCRRCLAFAGTRQCDQSHRSLVAASAIVVGRRIAFAEARGLSFSDSDARERFAPFVPHRAARMSHA